LTTTTPRWRASSRIAVSTEARARPALASLPHAGARRRLLPLEDCAAARIAARTTRGRSVTRPVGQCSYGYVKSRRSKWPLRTVTDAGVREPSRSGPAPAVSESGRAGRSRS
jgi:hypothetical protein